MRLHTSAMGWSVREVCVLDIWYVADSLFSPRPCLENPEDLQSRNDSWLGSCQALTSFSGYLWFSRDNFFR